MRYSEACRDAPLTDLGKQQARSLQPIVEEHLQRVQLVICSPLTRAIQTACLAFERQPQLPILAWPVVTEFWLSMPECHGRIRSQLQADPALLALERFAGVSLDNVNDDPEQPWWAFGDDEMRLHTFLSWLAACPETHIAVVAHWGFIHRILTLARCAREPEIDNACW